MTRHPHFFLLLLLFTSSTANAVPLLELLEPDEVDRPFSGRSASTGGNAAYFNPARLIGPGQRLALGYVGLFETTEVSRLPRPSGYDVSPEVYRARVNTYHGIN